MFGPIERRNAAGDVVEWLSVLECPLGARLYIESGDETASFDLDDAALDEAITQLSILRTNRKLALDVAQVGRENVRERQEQRFADAMTRGL